MGAPSEKKRKGNPAWNQRKQSQARLRTRPGTPSGVEEGSWQGPGGASGRVVEEQPPPKPCTEGASMNKMSWLLLGTGEAVGSWSQESSPETGESLLGPAQKSLTLEP